MQTVRQAFGNPQPPKEITQKAFDYDTKHLHRLARLRLGDSADPGDLTGYCLDLTYTEVQTALFRWVFPFCLAAWRQELLGAAPQYGVFVENFYPALVRGKILTKVTSEEERAAVARFFRETILEELDSQTQLRGVGSGAKPYRWMGAFATYGVLLPDLYLLWEAWWPASTVGRALGVVQYASCLIYGEQDNPVFPAWTPTEGGGPPELWSYEGFLYEDHWQEPNLAFLKTALTAETIGPALDRAVERLRESPELALAQQVQTDFACGMPLVRQRCSELLERLG